MNRSSSQSGFTLIEMIVSLALFSVVVTISVGALLVLIASNQRFQNEQSVMTNLSFALDSMTREIRTGTNYFCDSRHHAASGLQDRRIFEDGKVLVPDVIGDCWNGKSPHNARYNGISFVESGQSVTGSPNTKIAYFYDSDEQNIFRRVSGESALPLLSSSMIITDAEFYVTSSDPSSVSQPTVTIYIEVRDSTDPDGKMYKLQTMVTQRTLDL